MNNLNDTLTWKQNFGLLPVHLFPENKDESNFIMLNGGYGDFCLRTQQNEQHINEIHSYSWSSNTKNFIVLDSDEVLIYNWHKYAPEKIRRQTVENNLSKFYKYLLQSSYKSNKDIVPFLIDIFRQFRNFTQEKTNATDALNLLFTLLISIEEDITKINFEKWGLENIDIPPSLEHCSDRLRNGFSHIKPNLNLILRHTSGVLFQEAQKEVIFFDRQVDLWGNLSSSLSTKSNLYSSIHYTPPYLARTIVENSLRELNLSERDSIKIFDPACGSCEFLIETLKQLHETGYSGTVEISGWDISQTAVNTSIFLLSYEKRTIWNDRLTFNIRLVADSLQEEWALNHDLILMNPPFVSWEQMGKDYREAVRNILDADKIGRPNQASAFFYKAVLSISEEGVIGCVIPSSLLTLDAYNKLRFDVQELITLKLIGKLGNFVFEDALTDVSFIIGNKPKSNSVPYILWTRNERGIAQNALRDLRKMHYNEDYSIVENDYSIYQPISFPVTRENWKTISFQESELLKSINILVIQRKLVTLQEVFNVQQGIRTGNNNVFKLTREEFESIPDNEKPYFKPVIDNESVKGGQIIERNYVWYPYSSDGIIINTEQELISLTPYFYNSKLKAAKESLQTRARKDSGNWWHLSEHRAWLRNEEPRLVSTEFGKSDSFAFDKKGKYAVERGYAYLPMKEFKDLDSYYFYLSLFSSPFFDKLLSIYSRQLAGGLWYDLGKKHTKHIPIPNIHATEIKLSPAYEQLVTIGKDLAEGRSHLKSILDDIILKFIYPTH